MRWRLKKKEPTSHLDAQKVAEQPGVDSVTNVSQEPIVMGISEHADDMERPQSDARSTGSGVEMALGERTNQDEAATNDSAGQPAGSQMVKEPEYEGPLLKVSGVERSFQTGGRKLDVLKGIHMELWPKQLVMLRGRSGSGKTTLMNIIGGLDQPSRGEVYFKERPIHAWSDEKRTRIRRKEIGFIFQTYALLPLLSAYENVELSLRMSGYPRSEWKSRVKHCLELVGLGKRMDHRPFEMSGGEQQRVAIAKAIAHRPSLILADEPTAELDSQMGAQIMAVFQDIIEAEHVTICMTTHDPTILEVADHVYQMVDGRFTETAIEDIQP
ncbi:ABC transporter ATP-binding protein [Marinicrinis sediminis]|uniref:ABC transporter ATP-binding protein n=1 Tax=Marinicrinis sediminis TaxID=1652465 RepID=A0ABW5RBU0_9BACL